MVRITFIGAEGGSHEVEVEAGLNVKDAALQNNVPGIDGDCGGACACATCHVYVDAAWAERVGGPASDMERDMLAFADDTEPTSRLGCQITLTETLDGLVLRLPLGQH